jgi:hypothetical protein
LYEVVELHNTWSSLAGLSLFGLVGIWKGNPTRELRYALGYLILFLIGLGSAGLHGTLHWIFQSSDGKLNALVFVRRYSWQLNNYVATIIVHFTRTSNGILGDYIEFHRSRS